jgi:hypothetical protein
LEGSTGSEQSGTYHQEGAGHRLAAESSPDACPKEPKAQVNLDPLGFFLGPLLWGPVEALSARHRYRAYSNGRPVTVLGFIEHAGTRRSFAPYLALQRGAAIRSADAPRSPRSERVIPPPTDELQSLSVGRRHEWKRFPLLRYSSSVGEVLVYGREIDLQLLQRAFEDYAAVQS